jgi:hypothetical protein
MWYFGKDFPSEYSGERFEIAWEQERTPWELMIAAIPVLFSIE